MLELGSETLDLRPLYAGGFAMIIVVAWGADLDVARREKLEKLMLEYEVESAGSNWFQGGMRWQTYLARLKHRAAMMMGMMNRMRQVRNCQMLAVPLPELKASFRFNVAQSCRYLESILLLKYRSSDSHPDR